MCNMKKLISLVLALALVLAVATAFAGTITVDKVLEGETYSAYRILNYRHNGDAWNYYLTKAEYDSGLGAVLEGVGFSFAATADGTEYYVDNTDELTNKGADLATALKSADLSNALDKVEDVVADSDGQAVFSNLAEGYWFVKTSLGSLASLASYDAEALVVEKNTMITDEKIVSDTEAQVGDTLTYYITLTDGKGTNLEATLTDTMSKGLTYNGVTSIVAAGTGLNRSLTENSDYTVSTSTDASGNTVVVYTFTAAVMTALQDQDKIVVTYTATVNSDASLDGTETNTEFTHYSEQDTDGNTVTVELANLTILKTDGSNALKGAQFALFRTDLTFVPAANHTAVTLRLLTDAELTAANITKTADTVYYEVDATSSNTTIDMTDASKAVIYSLDKDSTYYIQETKAPEGYNKLTDERQVNLNTENEVTIENNAGTVLPSTGGIGTTIFYIVGGMLLVGAAIVLVARRKASN